MMNIQEKYDTHPIAHLHDAMDALGWAMVTAPLAKTNSPTIDEMKEINKLFSEARRLFDDFQLRLENEKRAFK